MKLASVLPTVALDRLTDGIVFACMVPLALFSIVVDDPSAGIRTGLVCGTAGSFAFFTALLLAPFGWRRDVSRADGLPR